MSMTRLAPIAFAGLLLLMSPGAQAAGLHTYVSLGDSLAYGYTDGQGLGPSLADQGYVKPYADALGVRDGVRPNVINLAIPGETSDSFFSGGGGVVGPMAP